MYLLFLCLILSQVTNVKAIEKDLKAQKAKLNEDEALYKSLEAKVVERERTGKTWSICLPSLEIMFLNFVVRGETVMLHSFNSETVARITKAVREGETSHV